MAAGGAHVRIKTGVPRWKEKLKEVCMQRVRQERYQLLWKIRNGGQPPSMSTVHNSKEVVASAFGCIVADELNKVKQTSLNGQGPHVDRPNDEASGECDMLWQYDTMALPLPAELADEDYEELMLVMERALYDDLQAELQIQEVKLLEEYEASRAIEDESLSELFEHWQGLQEGGVLCPLCKARRLQQNKQVITCGCGKFRLDTQDDQVGLEFLQQRLADVHQEHRDSGCHAQPSFSLEDRFGMAALYMTCSICRILEWVL